MQIDRWNGGTLRRYHLPHAILVVSRASTGERMVQVIPRSIPHIALPVDPAQAAERLQMVRVTRREAARKIRHQEAELRTMWTDAGVPKERQDELIAEIIRKAQPEYLAKLFAPQKPMGDL